MGSFVKALEALLASPDDEEKVFVAAKCAIEDSGTARVVDQFVERLTALPVQGSGSLQERVAMLRVMDVVCRKAVKPGAAAGLHTEFGRKMYRIVTKVLPRAVDARPNIQSARSITTRWASEGIFSNQQVANTVKYIDAYASTKSQRNASAPSAGKRRRGGSRGTSDVNGEAREHLRARVKETERFVEKERSGQKKIRLAQALREKNEAPRVEFHELWTDLWMRPQKSDEDFWREWNRDFAWKAIPAPAPSDPSSVPDSSVDCDASVVPVERGQSGQSAALHNKPKTDIELPQTVLLWDLDETLVVFQSLLDQKKARRYSWEWGRASLLGKRMERLIFKVTDDYMFFGDLQKIDFEQVQAEQLKSLDDGSALTRAVLESSLFVEKKSPSSGESKPVADMRQVAYRYRRIREEYTHARLEKGIFSAEPDMFKEAKELVTAIDALTGGWLSAGRAALRAAQERGYCNVVVSNGQLIPTLAKCILFGLDEFIKVDCIYSSANKNKPYVFQQVVSRFGGADGPVNFRAVGDGKEEQVAATHVGVRSFEQVGLRGAQCLRNVESNIRNNWREWDCV